MDFFIKRLCMVQKFKIDREARNKLKESCGVNLYAISNELQKLFILKESEKSINLQDTIRTITRIERDDVFEIVELILKKDLTLALQKALSLFTFDSNAAMMITYNLGYYLEKLAIIKSLLKKSIPIEGIAKALNIPLFILKKQYLKLAKTYRIKEIKRIVNELSDLDEQLKSTKYTHQVLIENFLIKTCEK